jgi:hypothetical protein
MDEKSMDAILGAAAGIAGLILLAIWPAQALSVLEGGIAVGLLAVGIWRLGRFAGLDWKAAGQQLTRLIQPKSGATPLGPPCEHCGAFTHPGAQFCLQCGGALAQPRICEGCQKQNLPAATFCGDCGQPLS